MSAIRLAENGLLPTPLIRLGIRRRLSRKAEWCARRASSDTNSIGRAGPIAVATDRANAQHYELPYEFYSLMLGPHMKYSSCLFAHREDTLERAEHRMLALTCERAKLQDGYRILELGCGWGSLSLYMAEHLPHSQITAVSNSVRQREYIQMQAQRRGLMNLQVITADVNVLRLEQRFDRVVSVEMFEHMRNWASLLERIFNLWLKPDGRLFVHYFCHRRATYLFNDNADDWMGRHFFSGGMMPQEDFLDSFAGLQVLEHHVVNGCHYARTLEAWLSRLDANREAVLGVLGQTETEFDQAKPDPVTVRYHRWRLFLLACAELFDYRSGQEWYVTHRLAGRR